MPDTPLPDKPPPETLATRVVSESRIFRIEQVDLRFSNGVEASYERISGRGGGGGAVLVVPISPDHELLLVREYAAGTERYELTFPKGSLERGEAPLDCANREIREETGFAARELKALRTLNLSPGYIRHATHIVLARGLYESPLEGDEPETLDLVRWPLEDARALLSEPTFSDARGIAALLLLLDALG
ncbi:MAG: ADP compounds hydrolase NudE [Gammaproteobacteria bacterium]